MSDIYPNNNNEMNYSNSYSSSESFTTPSVSPVIPEHHRNNKKGGLLRKVGAVTLSAVLFGGVAAATFQGVNRITGYEPANSQAVAQTPSPSDNSTRSELIKTVTTASTETVTKGGLDVTDIADHAMSSIVSITNKSVQDVRDYFSAFGYGGPFQQQEVESCGSGIIIGKNSDELLIVTNYHVIADADTLSVCFVDNEAYEAAVKGTDSSNDLAVVAVPLSEISDDTLDQIAIAVMGNSDNLKVGEQVVAIGNALGYGQSVTTGIVSALDRSIDEDSSESSDSATYIQTDAAINPGNSGGALLNMDGKVVGINSAKMASTAVEGMGYAIPVNHVSSIIENLMNETTRSKVASDSQGVLGISGTDVTSDVASTYGMPEGVYISEVTPGGAADMAGIKAKSIITKFDGKEVTSISELKKMLAYYSEGEMVDVTLMVPSSGNYHEKTISVTLGGSSEATSANSSNNSQFDGFNFNFR